MNEPVAHSRPPPLRGTVALGESPARQNVMPNDGTSALPGSRWTRWTRRVASAALDAGAAAVTWLAFHAYVGRCTVLHRERFPRTGATLVLANHPAIWLDVVVLDAALARPLRFLAQDTLYRPWPRGWLLDWFGSLRVARSALPHLPSPANADLSRRTSERFDRGEAIAVFPEDESAGDRSLGPLRTGGARIALGYHARHRLPLAVVPVGIHYADRLRARSAVVLDLGRPLDLTPYATLATIDPERAVRDLTEHMRRELSRRIVDAGLGEIGAVITGVETAVGFEHAAAQFARLRALARRLHALVRLEPERFRALRRASRILERAGQALHVRGALADPPRRTLAARIALGTLGVPIAALGATAHVLPWAVTEWIARRWARDPNHLGFARITAGLVLFPAAYIGWAWVLTREFGFQPIEVGAILALLPFTGLCAWWHAGWLTQASDRWRVTRLRRTHPALHARIAVARARLAGPRRPRAPRTRVRGA